MEYTFHVRNCPYRNVITVRQGSHTVAILAIEIDEGTTLAMVHLKYLSRSATLLQIKKLWKHLALHLEKKTYIAYIVDKPVIQKLAELLGFKPNGEYWHYVV